MDFEAEVEEPEVEVEFGSGGGGGRDLGGCCIGRRCIQKRRRRWRKNLELKMDEKTKVEVGIGE